MQLLALPLVTAAATLPRLQLRPPDWHSWAHFVPRQPCPAYWTEMSHDRDHEAIPSLPFVVPQVLILPRLLQQGY